MLHGNSNPDLDSFLKPIASELNELCLKSMVVKKNDEEVADARVLPLMITVDILAVSKMIYHSGHNSFYGCSFCHTLGEHDENGKGMYFAKRNCPLRPKERLLPGSNKPKPSKGAAPDPNNIQKDNAFKDSPSFLGVDFFGLDEMHLLSNVAKLVYSFLAPKDKKSHRPENCTDKIYPFFLDNASFNLIQQAMNKSRANIPLAFSGCFKGINQNTANFYTSVDWLGFLMYIVPVLEDNRLKRLYLLWFVLIRLLFNGMSLNPRLRALKSKIKTIQYNPLNILTEIWKYGTCFWITLLKRNFC